MIKSKIYYEKLDKIDLLQINKNLMEQMKLNVQLLSHYLIMYDNENIEKFNFLIKINPEIFVLEKLFEITNSTINEHYISFLEYSLSIKNKTMTKKLLSMSIDFNSETTKKMKEALKNFQ